MRKQKMDQVIKHKDTEFMYRAGEPICLFFIDMGTENEDTHYYRLPMRCIVEADLKTLDEWCKHPLYHVLDVAFGRSIKLPVRTADESEENFENRLKRREARVKTKKLVEDVIGIACLGQEIYPDDFIGGMNAIGKVVKVSLIAHC